MRFGDFELDQGRRQLLRRGEPLHLPPKQLLLLQMLLERRPNAVSKQELYDGLWPSTFVSDVNLPSLVADLRTALGDDPHNPHFIRTVHGFGYAFCGGPEEEEDASAGLATATLASERWRVQLVEGENVIGRDPSLRASIDDASVSRRHAVIVCGRDSFVIRDLDSKNGTLVGGIRIAAPRELHQGDVVTLGNVRLVFHRAAMESTLTVPDKSR